MIRYQGFTRLLKAFVYLDENVFIKEIHIVVNTIRN